MRDMYAKFGSSIDAQSGDFRPSSIPGDPIGFVVTNTVSDESTLITGLNLGSRSARAKRRLSGVIHDPGDPSQL